jgi:hypothetical protein
MATLTVCASGCDYTTLGAAVSAAAAIDIIELQVDVTENIAISKNITEICGTNSTITLNGTGNGAQDTLELQNGIQQLLTFRNLIINHSSGTARTIFISSINASGSLKFVDCEIKHTSGTESAYLFCQTNIHAGFFTAERTAFYGNSTADAVVFNNATTASSIRFDNCGFFDHTGGGHGLELTASTANSVLTLNYCNFNNNGQGLDIDCASTVKNCIFTNNTTDLDVTGTNFNRADFDYCAFEEQTDDDVAWGANNIFGITSTDEYVDEGASNFQLKDTAQCKDAGVSVGGITLDFSNSTREVGSAPDIGYLEKQAAMSGRRIIIT